jgi:hypothetical protein
MTGALSRASDPDRSCLECAHFDDDPARFEQAFPGIGILGSGYGDSRGVTGICLVLGRLVQPGDTCPSFTRREPPCASR